MDVQQFDSNLNGLHEQELTTPTEPPDSGSFVKGIQAPNLFLNDTNVSLSSGVKWTGVAASLSHGRKVELAKLESSPQQNWAKVYQTQQFIK